MAAKCSKCRQRSSAHLPPLLTSPHCHCLHRGRQHYHTKKSRYGSGNSSAELRNEIFFTPPPVQGGGVQGRTISPVEQLSHASSLASILDDHFKPPQPPAPPLSPLHLTSSSSSFASPQRAQTPNPSSAELIEPMGDIGVNNPSAFLSPIPPFHPPLGSDRGLWVLAELSEKILNPTVLQPQPSPASAKDQRHCLKKRKMTP
jgi:hypothetical protein